MSLYEEGVIDGYVVGYGSGNSSGTIDLDNFTTTSTDNININLSWTNPTFSNYEEVVIVRNETRYPTNPSDGTVIYIGNNNTYTDTPSIIRSYYYRGFVVSSNSKNKKCINISITIVSLDNPNLITVYKYGTFIIPNTVVAHFSDGTQGSVAVTWNPNPSTIDTSTLGEYTSNGTVENYSGSCILTVDVVEAPDVTSLDPRILGDELIYDDVIAFINKHKYENIYWHYGSGYSGGYERILICGTDIYTYWEEKPLSISIWTRFFATNMNVLDATLHENITEFNTGYAYSEHLYRIRINETNAYLDDTKDYCGGNGVGSASYLP